MKTKVVAVALGWMLIALGATLVADEPLPLQAESVWLPEVEQMYQSDVPTPAWVADPSGLTVVQGVVGRRDQSARALAIWEVLCPRLKLAGQESWSKWERSIAEREMGRWLDQSGCIIERLEQPFQKLVDGKRYDAFTREAWLLDLSKADLASVEKQVQRAVHRASHHKRATIGVAIVAVGLAAAACWLFLVVLDRLTRGYYIGWLRLAAMTVVFVSVGLAVHITQFILRHL